ncbi:hypothetical protein LVJ94_14365 [Pendulispora rubella]|uniref:Uncharacterized protein n=1 Tax=Pendulispora rubella TaxID=2741070 RepID=A0ABZ2LF65_9BACT
MARMEGPGKAAAVVVAEAPVPEVAAVRVDAVVAGGRAVNPEARASLSRRSVPL